MRLSGLRLLSMKVKVVTSNTPNDAVDRLNSFLTEEDVIPYSISFTFLPSGNRLSGMRYLAVLRYELAHNFRKGSIRLEALLNVYGLESFEEQFKLLAKPAQGKEVLCHDIFTTHKGELMALVLEL